MEAEQGRRREGCAGEDGGDVFGAWGGGGGGAEGVGGVYGIGRWIFFIARGGLRVEWGELIPR